MVCVGCEFEIPKQQRINSLLSTVAVFVFCKQNFDWNIKNEVLQLASHTSICVASHSTSKQFPLSDFVKETKGKDFPVTNTWRIMISLCCEREKECRLFSLIWMQFFSPDSGDWKKWEMNSIPKFRLVVGNRGIASIDSRTRQWGTVRLFEEFHSSYLLFLDSMTPLSNLSGWWLHCTERRTESSDSRLWHSSTEKGEEEE